ncbi:MAG: DUF1328 domain-containing protein [Deltaproteobacteria bacterium]|nr:DUF1328 domain-containing protein [Deltaproteobacteria bacterium]
MFGFGNIAAAAAGIARILFLIFLRSSLDFFTKGSAAP